MLASINIEYVQSICMQCYCDKSLLQVTSVIFITNKTHATLKLLD